MMRGHRTLHRRIWLALSIVLPFLFAAAILARPRS
jgi:hypothetical protein